MDPVQSILFVSLSCVGDAVMTTPVLEALHARFPSARVDIVADKRSAILFSQCPYRGEILLKDKKKFLRGAPELLSKLRKKNYDLIVDLRTDGLAWLCRGRRRLTKWNRRPYGHHAVEQFMGVIHSLHGTDQIPAAKVWISEKDAEFASIALKDLPSGRWLLLAPAVALDRKRWPAENYSQLANRLRDLFAAVILDGGPSETAATAAVARGLNLPFVDLAGRTSLLQAAAVQTRAALFVGSDSGLGHVAAAMSVPTLTLFSNDTPERVLPWGAHAEWIKSPDGLASTIRVEDVERKIRQMFSPAKEDCFPVATDTR